MKYCLWCNRELPAFKKKYCDSLCQYRYKTWKKDTCTKFSKAQFIRMAKAASKQKNSAVRYN